MELSEITAKVDIDTSNIADAWDRLAYMFQKQKDLMDRVEEEHGELQFGISQDVTSIVGELGEILEHNQSWKHWRKQIPEIDDEHQLEEVADLWHFMIQLTIRLGYTADDIFTAYEGKNKKNFERQDNDY